MSAPVCGATDGTFVCSLPATHLTTKRARYGMRHGAVIDERRIVSWRDGDKATTDHWPKDAA